MSGESMTAATLRQILRRARIRFSDLLRLEIKKTLGSDASEEDIDQELSDLRLLKYNVCRRPR